MSIDIERSGRTVVITMNRPDTLNALDLDHLDALHEALRDFRDEPSLLVAVLTGTERAFCVGTDLKNAPSPSASFAEGYFLSRQESVDAGVYVRALVPHELNIRKPLIGAVNGYAVGGGLELALSCDLRLAGNTASFGLPEVKVASIPGIGGASQLLRAIPRAVAMKMILTGERIDADRAYECGLVSDLHPAGELVDRAIECAQTIAGHGPLAVQALKAVTMGSEDRPLSQAVELEQIMWGLLRDTDDRREGRAAFVERRTPDFQGR